MEIKVNLDGLYDDSGDSLAWIIKAEIEAGLRTEARKMVNQAIKDHGEQVKKAIEAEIRKITPNTLADLLKVVKKTKEEQ